MANNVRYGTAEVAAALGARFQVRGILREGGQGIVYRAARHRTADGRQVEEDVALKLYFDPTQDNRVDREIRALRGYRHPNLAFLIEDGRIELGGNVIRFVAWEFIPGDPLDQRITEGPLSPKLVAAIGRDVARAIDHLWARRIVHRDVNPRNTILRRGDAAAVLIDLGVARHLDMTTLTGPGMTWGTLGYCSPEQYRAEQQLTCASDVYSLAVSLQEALIGRHPTRGDQTILYRNTPKTVDLDPRIPVGLANLLDEMLSFRAAFRPQPSAISERFAHLAAELNT